MSDLVERLRYISNAMGSFGSIEREAADEIERLRNRVSCLEEKLNHIASPALWSMGEHHAPQIVAEMQRIALIGLAREARPDIAAVLRGEAVVVPREASGKMWAAGRSALSSPAEMIRGADYEAASAHADRIPEKVWAAMIAAGEKEMGAVTREDLIKAIEIPCIARDGSISADWLAMTLADEARIEHDRLVNPEYLAVKIAKVSDEILARVVRAEKERDEARAEVERLREALAPFAKAGELFPERHPDGFDMVIYAPAAGPAYNIVAEDLRRARAVLNPEKPDARD